MYTKPTKVSISDIFHYGYDPALDIRDLYDVRIEYETRRNNIQDKSCSVIMENLKEGKIVVKKFIEGNEPPSLAG